MRIHEIVCESDNTDIYLYGDPEFAVCMWPDIEADDQIGDSEEVVRIKLRKNDKLRVTWLGFEVVDGVVVNNVEVEQDFGAKMLDPARVKYKGWLPTNRTSLQDGTRDGLRIFRRP